MGAHMLQAMPVQLGSLKFSQKLSFVLMWQNHLRYMYTCTYPVEFLGVGGDEVEDMTALNAVARLVAQPQHLSTPQHHNTPYTIP